MAHLLLFLLLVFRPFLHLTSMIPIFELRDTRQSLHVQLQCIRLTASNHVSASAARLIALLALISFRMYS